MDITPFLKQLRHPLALAIAVFIVLVLGGYSLLFSPVGNQMLKPLVASALSERFSQPITVDTFILTPNHYTFLLHDKDHIPFSIDGTYSLIGLKTQGTLTALGASADYKVRFNSFSLDTLQLRFHSLSIASVLDILDYPSKSSSILNGNIDLSGLSDRKIQGNIHLWSTTTAFVPTSIIEEDSNTSWDLYEWLADEEGAVQPFEINCTAHIALDEIGVIEQLIGYPLRGIIDLKTRIEGDEKKLRFNFQTHLAKSDTKATLLYQDLVPHSVRYSILHADAKKLFAFLNLPAPIIATVDSHGMFGPRTGKIELTLVNGKIRPNVLLQEYEIHQPPSRFNAKILANISEQNIRYHASFRSDVGRLELDNTTTHSQMLAELLRSIP